MSYAYLIDPENQYMTKSGTINVGGFLKVFDAVTDDPAVTYCDFSGTENPERIVFDNNGRAVVIAEAEKAYRVEVYDRYGTLQWTTTPLWCRAEGSGAAMVDIISTDMSVSVDRTSTGGSVTFDLSVARDGTELLEWIRCEGYTGTNVMVPTYAEGPMEVGEAGIILYGERYYHVTARVTAVTTSMPYYNEFTLMARGMDGDGQVTTYRSERLIVDCSTELHQDYEVSFDIMPESDIGLYFETYGVEEGVSVGLVDVQVHRVYSGAPSVPGSVAPKPWVVENFQEKLSGGPGIELSGNYIAVDFDTVQGKLEEGDGIDIVDDTVSVDFTEVQEKLEAAAGIELSGSAIGVDFDVVQGKLTEGEGIDIDGDTISVDFTEVQEKLEAGAGIELSGNGIAVDFDTVQSKLTAGDNIVIEGDVISAIVPEYANADWDATSGEPGYIDHKPDLSIYATQAELSGYQEVLTPGEGITIENNVISATNSFEQLNSDWDATSGVQEILNKPQLKELVAGANISISEGSTQVTISATAAPQQNADWDATSGVQEILNKPDLTQYVKSNELATVATTGDYNDLDNLPTIPAAQVQTDWDATSGMGQLLNKPDLSVYAQTSDLAAVATTGSYNSLTDKPTIPAAQVNSDWDATSGVQQILNKPSIPTIGTITL